LTISCAYRCGVIDTSAAEPVPAVYILERYTDHALISRLGPWIFSSALSNVRPSLTQEGAVNTIRVHNEDRQCLFSASAQPATNSEKLDSHIFNSLDSFARFVKLGVASYTPATHGDALARVDLQKNDTRYEALDATVAYSMLDDLWPNAGLTFDSAVRATGGTYVWTYQGTIERELSYVSSR